MTCSRLMSSVISVADGDELFIFDDVECGAEVRANARRDRGPAAPYPSAGNTGKPFLAGVGAPNS
jgi:hypothetical protein